MKLTFLSAIEIIPNEKGDPKISFKNYLYL
jgi:hypothetical protein